MSIDRAKYMGKDEVRTLRTVAEARAITDLQGGRINGVLAWMVVDLALSTGLRVSELVALDVQDLDLRLGAVKVARLKKRKKTIRTVPIDKRLIRHLKDYLVWRADRIDDLDEDYSEGLTEKSGALLVGQRGPLTNRGAQQIWKTSIKRAGLRADLSIHAARHTMAVFLLRKTGNLRMVQKQLGHSSPTITANLYADVTFEDQQKALNGLYEDDNGNSE
ncbi:MAG: site-specific integrase [Sedimentisphaerales bacterium]|nr:site-specific integrase [Sedimentisphaerales bacterium]